MLPGLWVIFSPNNIIDEIMMHVNEHDAYKNRVTSEGEKVTMMMAEIIGNNPCEDWNSERSN